MAVSRVGRMFASVSPDTYFQCSETMGPGNTFTRMGVLNPPLDAVAVSSFATVLTFHRAPTRPPESVGELPVTVPDPGAALQVTERPATPRPKASTVRARMESGSGWPACTEQQNTVVSGTGLTAAMAPTGKWGPIANGRYRTP